MRNKLAESVALGLTAKSLESSSHRDVVSLALVLPDRAHYAEILRGLRDKYIAQTKKRTIEVLRGVEAFLLRQSDQSRTDFAGYQKKLSDLESQFPGIDPGATDPTVAQETALALEKIDLERQTESLKVQSRHWTDRLEISSVTANGSQDGRPVRRPQAPNPRFFDLRQQIEKIERDLSDAKSVRMMTDEHPVVVRLSRSLSTRRAELECVPAMVDRQIDATSTSAADSWMAAAQHADLQISEAEAKLQTAENRMGEISQKMARLQDERILAAGHREEYLSIKQKADRAREELTTWTQNLSPLRHIVTLENDNRGIHFSTVQDVVANPRPNSPDALLVVVACLAIGIASGGLSVLLRELFDRSFRTVKHLSSSLGIPVIESIDEIMTQTTHRQRRVRRLITLPATALVLTIFLSATGLMAYLSIQNPNGYERVKTSPTSVFEVLLEQP